MAATATIFPPKQEFKIPDDLVWEVLDGKPLYRRGYMQVVKKLKTYQDIMGTSSYQSIITTYLTLLLGSKLDFSRFDIMIGEIGVHLNHKDNVSNDIAIFNRLEGQQFSKKYVDFAPKIVIEIDIDIDPSCMPDMEYLTTKTQKLLDFGVEQVIWVLTNNKTVMVATPDNPPLIMDWHRDIEIFEGITFNIQSYLTGRGIDV